MTDGGATPATSQRRRSARLRLRQPDQKPAAEPVDRRDNKEQNRTYRLALASFALSAVVAAVTPVSAFIVADRTAQANAGQADKSFIRDQQKSAYSDFYAAAVQVAEAEANVAMLFITPRPESLPASASTAEINKYLTDEFNNRNKVLGDKLNNFTAKYSLVYMVGKDDAVAAAQHLRDFFRSDKLQAAQFKAFGAAISRAPDLRDTVGDFLKELEPADKILQDYLDALRNDYGPDRVG